MRVVSACTGIGLLDEAARLAVPSAEIVAQADTDKGAQAFLRSRGADPFGDLLEIDTAADMLIAGFPCQPFSTAGKKRGTADDRWLWPKIAELIDRVRPAFAFFENVAPLRKHGLGEILRDLAVRGFDAEWSTLSAADIGATHQRDRIWILAYRDRRGLQGLCAALDESGRGYAPGEQPGGRSEGVAGLVQAGAGQPQHSGVGDTSGEPEWQQSKRAEQRATERGQAEPQLIGEDLPLFPPLPGDAVAWATEVERRPETQPSIRGVVDGSTAWTLQLKQLGNGVVPLAAAYALRALAHRALSHG